jgi:hypothetical protein
MTLALLLASALRAAVLGAIVWSALKILRLRDSGTETIIWTVVLAASLLMPLMAQAVPAVIHIPLLWPHMRVAGQPVLEVALVSGGHIVDPSLGPLWHGLQWFGRHGLQLSWCAYALITLAGLARLGLGLIFTARLYRASQPVEAPWANNRRIRSSNRITGPVSCGSWIILPEDYPDWSAKKLAAVLAHEQAHLDRGDFFIQLLAVVYRILFWFSPFAWWLQAHLCALAETASDEAAVRLINDRATYAEILLDVSRKVRGTAVFTAMAKGPNIRLRLDHILKDAPAERRLGRWARILAATAILPVAGLLASANAEIPPALPLHASLVAEPFHADRDWRTVMSNPDLTSGRIPSRTPLVVSQAKEKPVPLAPAGTMHPGALEQAEPARDSMSGAPVNTALAASGPGGSDFTYNPRALLDGQSAVLLPAIIPVRRDEHGTKASAAPTVILNINSPDGAPN